MPLLGMYDDDHRHNAVVLKERYGAEEQRVMPLLRLKLKAH